MAGELKHLDVGVKLSKAEWEAAGTHVLNGQAVGDMIYASSITQLSRLAIGIASYILAVQGGVPTWRAVEDVIADSGLTEIRLTPKASSSGAEGTIFYDSDDDHVWVATE